MIGKKNGMILITSFNSKNSNGMHKWNYVCDCGKIGVISTGEFNRNRSKLKSCGCHKPSIDISKKKFGKLEAISIHHKKGYKYQWLCKCDCGNLSVVEQCSLIRGRTKTCGKGCIINTPEWIEEKKQKIKDRVKIDKNNCWIWQGPIRANGYGCFNSGLIDQHAHRASYKLLVGEIPDGLCVLHKCDVKLCCNPDHLYTGDIKQNVKDAIERGQFPRGPNPKKGHKGEKNCKSKLSKYDVLKIREMYQPYVFGTYKIAKLFNVSNNNIKNIIKRKIWKHV